MMIKKELLEYHRIIIVALFEVIPHKHFIAALQLFQKPMTAHLNTDKYLRRLL